ADIFSTHRAAGEGGATNQPLGDPLAVVLTSTALAKIAINLDKIGAALGHIYCYHSVANAAGAVGKGAESQCFHQHRHTLLDCSNAWRAHAQPGGPGLGAAVQG